MLSEKDREELVVNNMKLAKKVANNYSGLGMEYDDLVSIGYIALVKAAKGYDDERGEAKFSTYAVKAMRREIIREIRKQWASSKLNDYTVISLDDKISDEDSESVIGDFVADENVDVQRTVVNYDQIAKSLTMLLNQAPPKESLIFLLYLCEMSANDISKLVHVNSHKVSQALQKWLRILPDFIHRYDFSKYRTWLIEPDGKNYIIRVRRDMKLYFSMCNVAEECGIMNTVTLFGDEASVEIFGDERIFAFLVRVFRKYLGYDFEF